MSITTKEDLRSILQADVADVVFTKVRGGERKMRCTLKAEFLPVIEEDNQKPARDDSDAQERNLVVYDLQANDYAGGWRTIRVANVTEIVVLEGYDPETATSVNNVPEEPEEEPAAE